MTVRAGMEYPGAISCGRCTGGAQPSDLVDSYAWGRKIDTAFCARSSAHTSPRHACRTSDCGLGDRSARMRRRWSLAALLAAPTLVLASLYMPWRAASCANADVNFFSASSSPSAGLQNMFAFACSHERIDGWSSVGDLAALSALLLALATVGAIVWPSLWSRLPALPLGLVLAYFVLAVAAQTRLDSQRDARQPIETGAGGLDYHVAYGMYVGLAGAALALLGAGFAIGGARSVRPPLRRLCVAALTTGFLVSLLLPWHRMGLTASLRVSELGVTDPAGAIAAVAALGLLSASWATAGTRSIESIGLALGALLFGGAAFAAAFDVDRAYGAWIGLGLALLAALVTLADRSVLDWIRPMTAYLGAAATACAAVVTSLFLPWQTACYGHTADLSRLGLAGRCVSSNGLGLVGSTAALLTIGLVVAVATPGFSRRVVSSFELATGVCLLLATVGFRLHTGSQNGVRLGVGYGSIVGFVAAAVLVALVLARVRLSWPDVKSMAPRLLPLGLGGVYVAAVVVPWWGVLPDEIWSTFRPRFAAISWLTITSALLGIRLVYVWAGQSRGNSDRGPELVLLSVALVALGVLDAVPLPTVQLTWNGGVLLGLGVPLTLLALIEERGGLRNVRVPEILRVDRI
jgi:hypothetical protein